MCFGSAPGHEHRGGRGGKAKEAKAEKERKKKKKKRKGGGEISTRAGLTNDASLHMPRLTLQIRVEASDVAVYDAREEEEEE